MAERRSNGGGECRAPGTGDVAGLSVAPLGVAGMDRNAGPGVRARGATSGKLSVEAVPLPYSL
jgi:hypothetical protein